MNLPESLTQYFQAIRTRDRAAWLATFSDQEGLLQIDPVGTPSRCTKEEIGGFWDQITSLFAQVELTPTAVYHGGPQQLALNWRGQGTASTWSPSIQQAKFCEWKLIGTQPSPSPN